MALDPQYYDNLQDDLSKLNGILNKVVQVIDRATGSVIINGVPHFTPTELQQIELANNVIIPMLTAALVRLNHAKNLVPELP